MTVSRFNDILRDDVVLYISGRHHISPHDLVDIVMSQAQDDGGGRIPVLTLLDDNEYRIIRDLISIYINNV